MSSDQEIDLLSDPEERRVLFAALDSFRQYRHAAHYNITHLRRQAFYCLPGSQMELLSSPPFNLTSTFAAVDSAIDENADIAESILAVALETYGVDPDSTEWKGTATANDMDKARSTIRQFYRDWTTEAEDERRASFEPMLAALNRASATVPAPEKCHLTVLIPGAGLARLAFEVCRAGYAVEGNEISYHQLMASNWVLNYQQVPSKWPLSPWALSFSNHLSRSNQLRKIMIPDMVAGHALSAASEELKSEVHAFQRMSMSSGDFCVLYKEEEYANTFDAVLTCFFIDTAPNLISYIETMKHCLKPGGAWINLGPLLWHFDGGGHNSKMEKTSANASDGKQRSGSDKGIGESGSFELSEDEVVHLVRHFGFEFAHHDTISHDAGYIQDPHSMLRNTYRPSFWVAKKNTVQ